MEWEKEGEEEKERKRVWGNMFVILLTILCVPALLLAKGKGEVPLGCLLSEPVTLVTPGAKPWHYAVELRTL